MNAAKVEEHRQHLLASARTVIADLEPATAIPKSKAKRSRKTTTNTPSTQKSDGEKKSNVEFLPVLAIAIVTRKAGGYELRPVVKRGISQKTGNEWTRLGRFTTKQREAFGFPKGETLGIRKARTIAKKLRKELDENVLMFYNAKGWDWASFYKSGYEEV